MTRGCLGRRLYEGVAFPGLPRCWPSRRPLANAVPCSGWPRRSALGRPKTTTIRLSLKRRLSRWRANGGRTSSGFVEGPLVTRSRSRTACRVASRMAVAVTSVRPQWIARSALSNRMRNESPAVFDSRPPNVASSPRATSSCMSTVCFQAASPRRWASSSSPTTQMTGLDGCRRHDPGRSRLHRRHRCGDPVDRARQRHAATAHMTPFQPSAESAPANSSRVLGTMRLMTVPASRTCWFSPSG
jgi:hypothetical protein